MKTIRAVEMLRQIIKENKLENWQGGVNNRLKTVFGRCNGRQRFIELSSQLVKINEEKVVRRVILHEVAHALTPMQKHNSNWKYICRKIGGDGKARYSFKDTNMVGRIHLPTGNEIIITPKTDSKTKVYKFTNKAGIEITITETHV